MDTAMDLFAFPPIAALLDLAYAGLMGMADLLTPLAGAFAAALAVVIVTLFVRALLIPVGISQARAEQTRARLAPRIRELQKRFKKSPERLQRELMQLYRDERTSPFAGFLPVLLQLPVVGILYAVFLHTTIAGHPNALLDETLFGAPLGSSVIGGLGGEPATLIVGGLLVALIALVGELTRRLLRMPQPPRDPESPVPAIPAGVLGLLQFATAVVALFVPLAAAIYLLVTVAWTLGQRLILRRFYPPITP
jgi:YidC/Oxa1 family membrane protein insertase